VLVTKPELVTQIFRNDNIFVKGGNIKKIPHSAFARIFGVNIIYSNGHLYKSFMEIIKPGIQRKFDLSPAQTHSAWLAQQLLQQQAQRPDTGVEIEHDILKWAISIFVEYFLDLNPDSVRDHVQNLQEEMDTLKVGISTRLHSFIFTLFPSLERVYWLLPSGNRGVRIADRLEGLLMDLAKTAHEGQTSTAEPRDDDKLIHRLKRAYADGAISDYHFRCNLKQLFVAGVENTDIVLNSVIWELGKNVPLQSRLRKEIFTFLPERYSESDLDELPLLTATIYEILRLYPPLLTLINRYTAEPVCLGPISNAPIPKGTWIGWHAYGTHTDPNIWGPSAHEFDPDRWGHDKVTINNRFRSTQVRGKYVPFATHTRRCLGSKFAIMHMKIALCELLRVSEWEQDSSYAPSLVTVGYPFPQLDFSGMKR
jgi:unspecific monooxygenase